jgi:glycosyltransferase involved in cell wall biosynthesis
MKRSVVVIAHNEAARIEACLKSLLHQTLPADEIILVAHNCTDGTAERARVFGDVISIDEFQGPPGIIHARIRGISRAAGDRIFCIDGDTRAKENWIREMDRQLSRPITVLTGSYVNISGPLFWKVFSPINRYLCLLPGRATANIWGASFAFPAYVKNFVVDSLKESEEVARRLHLVRNPDDYWLALRMQQHGVLRVTNRTEVFTEWKQTTNAACLERNRQDVSGGRKMLAYYNQQRS